MGRATPQAADEDDMSTPTANPALSDSSAGKKPGGGAEYYWLWVLCLLGLDYFSTLAYQPSITYHETKRLGPLATTAIVLLTLFGALPVYCYLARRSPGGQGSFGIVDRLIRGWGGKTVVLILLGFAATDFTMLKSLSLADASVHTLHKHDGHRFESLKELAGWCKDCAVEYVHQDAGQHVNEHLIVAIVLGIVSFIFWFVLRRGFNRNVMYIAVPLVGLYLLLTAILILGGLWRFYERPEIITHWLEHVQYGEHEIAVSTHDLRGWGTIALWSVWVLPTLALGLSGFELSMILMPQVTGKRGEDPPWTRIWNTRKVLSAAAFIMSAFLIGSVLVTTLLIPAQEFARKDRDKVERDGYANDRALSYLAHGGKLAFVSHEGNWEKQVEIDEPLLPICGAVFGTLYDIVTVLILCLAGTSVMTALSVLLPLFLLRFGMEFRWADRWGLLLLVFAGINMLVTLYFKADVEDQRGAYATGVLVLMASASLVTVFDKRKAYRQGERGWAIVWFFNLTYFGLIAAAFMIVMLVVSLRSASGLGITLCFIAAILAMSIVSRAWRADERRTIGFEFKDQQSEFMWNSLRDADFPILVPTCPGQNHEQKETQIRAAHQLSPHDDIVFLEISVDDPSDFFQKLMIEVARDGNRFVIKVTNCVSVAHAIAAIALEMSRHSKPPGLHFGWPEQSMLAASWSYLAFGEGNIPWKVRELIQRAEKDPAKRPRVIVG
jgi:hypothetical protein